MEINRLDEDFEQFWKAYPRKVAKGDARKAWKQTTRIRPPLEALLESLQAAMASEQWVRDGGQFIPYPATWLRGERWDDEYEIAQAAPTRPSITCISCKQRVFTWTDGRCDSCWRRYQGIAA